MESLLSLGYPNTDFDAITWVSQLVCCIFFSGTFKHQLNIWLLFIYLFVRKTQAVTLLPAELWGPRLVLGRWMEIHLVHYNAWLIYSLPVYRLLAHCGPVRILGAEALMKHSCVQGVLSEESAACLREGRGVTMEEARARPLKSNSTSPA